MTTPVGSDPETETCPECGEPPVAGVVLSRRVSAVAFDTARHDPAHCVYDHPESDRYTIYRHA